MNILYDVVYGYWLAQLTQVNHVTEEVYIYTLRCYAISIRCNAVYKLRVCMIDRCVIAPCRWNGQPDTNNVIHQEWYIIINCIMPVILFFHFLHACSLCILDYNYVHDLLCRAEMQVRTARDYCTDSWLWYFLSGGLNHQTAHHLFPGMPTNY